MLCEPSRGARAGASARASATCAIDTSAAQVCAIDTSATQLNASAAAGATREPARARAASASAKVSQATNGPTSAGGDGEASGEGCPANLLVGKRIRVYWRAERRWFTNSNPNPNPDLLDEEAPPGPAGSSRSGFHCSQPSVLM